MEQERADLRRLAAVALQHLLNHARQLARGVQNHGAAVHEKRRVEVQLQRFGVIAIGVQHGIDNAGEPVSGLTMQAPAPSPKRMAVSRCSGLIWTARDMISAPTTSTLPYAAARCEAMRDSDQRAGAGNRQIDGGNSGDAERGADGGRRPRKSPLARSAGDEDEADLLRRMPARSRQSARRRVRARRRVCCGAAKRRSAMPVTCSSHASSAPTMGAISALVTTREGKYRAECSQIREAHFFSKYAWMRGWSRTYADSGRNRERGF